MGWWDWIVGVFNAGDLSAEVAPTANSSTEATSRQEGAVATLEAPSEAAEASESAIELPWWTPRNVTQTELVQISRPELTHDARAFEHLLVSHFDGHDLSLPSIPYVLEQVLRLLRDRECNYTEVARVIGEDQAIAAAVLRMVNSPLYRGLDKIVALKPAITRLGAKAVHTLMMHQALRSSAFASGGDTELSKSVWLNSLSSAFIMRGLCKFTPLDQDDAFLIGLLHDIGNVVVLRLAHSEAEAGRYDADWETFEYFCHECHREFGELIADEWKLPDRIKHMITDHHTFPDDDDPLRSERIQLQLADMINAMIGYGSNAQYDLLNTQPVQALGLAERDDFIEFLQNLPDELDEMVAAL